MSLMAVGYKVKKIFSLIESGELLDLESVVKKAKELEVAVSFGLEDNSKKQNLWYAKLAENLFCKKKLLIPDFIDIGFGEELVESCKVKLPEKTPWKFLVTRKGFSGWCDAVVVNTFTKEEALNILRVYYQDFLLPCSPEGLGFGYSEPAAGTESKYKWREIRGSKPGTYKKYLEKSCRL